MTSPTILAVTLADFEEQLELNGVAVDELTADDVAELRQAYHVNPEAEWMRFESIAIVAAAFATTRKGPQP